MEEEVVQIIPVDVEKVSSLVFRSMAIDIVGRLRWQWRTMAGAANKKRKVRVKPVKSIEFVAVDL